jgi:heterodisulfide reductase subunit A-like polyferredoxin
MDKVAFLNSQIACAMIEMAAMQTENQDCVINNRSPFYKEKDFNYLIQKYGLGQNEVITWLQA